MSSWPGLSPFRSAARRRGGRVLRGHHDGSAANGLDCLRQGAAQAAEGTGTLPGSRRVQQFRHGRLIPGFEVSPVFRELAAQPTLYPTDAFYISVEGETFRERQPGSRSDGREAGKEL